MSDDEDDNHVNGQQVEDEEPFSLAQPYGARASTCGYCGPPGQRSVARSSYTFGLDAVQLSCMVYQHMIDRGWRRSGTYCYKPDLSRSCCPQYTIRLDARQFKPSRSQRKVLYRFNRFVLGEGKPGEGGHDDGGANNAAAGGQPAAEGSSASKKPKSSAKSKNKNKGKDFTPNQDAVAAAGGATSSVTSSFPLVDELHSAEYAFVSDEEKEKVVHRYEVTLEPSSFTEEKFKLFCAYQNAIHKDDDENRQSFKNFLCNTPLKRQTIPYEKQPLAHLPSAYGSYHHMYRMDGELIAMGVIDVLPRCVSSVYLMYDPKWEAHSLGKLSALKEIALAQEISAHGAPGMGYLYMGFYIHTCPKMKYKGQYAPSFLLDPEEYTWCPIEKASPLLDKHLYIPFSKPTRASRPTQPTQSSGNNSNAIDQDDDDMSDDEDATSSSQPQLSSQTLAAVQVGQIASGTIYTVPAQRSRYWANSYSRELITRAATLLGEEAAPKVILLPP